MERQGTIIEQGSDRTVVRYGTALNEVETPCLAAEVQYINDEKGGWHRETPEQRFVRVSEWVNENLAPVGGSREP